MLSMLRDSTGGWLAKIFIFLLVASFAVYGVSASFFSNTTGAVISVGETKVSALDYRLAYERQVNQLSQSLRTRITNEQAQSFGIPQTVLANLTTGAVLDENASKMGLGLSDDRLAALIGEDQGFRDASGNFSREQLRIALDRIGMSEADYVNNRKSVAIRNQLIEGVSDSAVLPNRFFDIVAKSQGEKRIFEYLTVTADDIKDPATASAEQLKEYYETNPQNYTSPEYRKVLVVKLEAGDISNPDSITDDRVEEAYNERKAQFTTAEKRQIQQLIFSDEKKAEDALKRIQAGETFETIILEQGKTATDVDLGGLLEQKDIPDVKVAKAAFDLELNSTSELIDGVFGKVLLRVIEIHPETVKPLAEVKEQLKKSIALEEAENLIFETHDRFEDERAAGETLEVAAKNVGLTVRTLDAIDRTARDAKGDIISDLPESQKLIAEIFDTEVQTETDPISIGHSGFVWFEVSEITPERLKTQEEVKDQLADDWKQAENDKATNLLAEAIKSKLDGGTDFETAVADVLKIEKDAVASRISKSLALAATDTSSDLNANAIRAAFASAVNTGVVANNVDDTGKLVIKVTEVQENAPLPVAKNIKDQLNANLSNDLLIGLVNELRTKQEVIVNRAALQAATRH